MSSFAMDAPLSNVRESSVRAQAGISQGRRKLLQDAIYEECQVAQRRGVRDLSGQEIRRALEQRFSAERGREVRVDVSSLSAPISRLVTAGRLERLDHTRACTITAQNIHPLRVVAYQSRLEV